MIFGPALALALAPFAGLEPGQANTGARVSLEAPLECPDASSLARRIDAYLGHPLAAEVGVVVVGRVHVSSAVFVLELTTEVAGVRDRQRLTDHDCAALVEVAASLAAIAIDPLALALRPTTPRPDPHETLRAETQPPPAPAQIEAPPTPAELAELATLAELTRPAQLPAPEPEPELIGAAKPPEFAKPARPRAPAESVLLLELYPSANPDEARPANDEPTANERQTRALVLATGGLALNLFPNPAPQVHGGVGLQHGSSRLAWRTELGAGATFAGRFRSDDRSAGGDLLAWDIAIRPCGVPRWGIVELRVCAALGGGQIRARGIGVRSSQRRNHPWLWLAAEAGVGVSLGRTVALVLDLGLDFNLLRPNFSVSNPDVSYLTPIVSGHGRLGVELRFF